eukprot:TRINITY_DN25049_c0_g1_i1.p1 TRINITY_DN25049_c0_g1~~TRINITY_DN25049_c0_g1_i1.p1  ORF type:complete len:468 (-),score=87.65 TRINITY_DN25049_c0_g1_i1:32-1435(-)
MNSTRGTGPPPGEPSGHGDASGDEGSTPASSNTAAVGAGGESGFTPASSSTAAVGAGGEIGFTPASSSTAAVGAGAETGMTPASSTGADGGKTGTASTGTGATESFGMIADLVAAKKARKAAAKGVTPATIGRSDEEPPETALVENPAEELAAEKSSSSEEGSVKSQGPKVQWLVRVRLQCNEVVFIAKWSCLWAWVSTRFAIEDTRVAIDRFLVWAEHEWTERWVQWSLWRLAFNASPRRVAEPPPLLPGLTKCRRKPVAVDVEGEEVTESIVDVDFSLEDVVQVYRQLRPQTPLFVRALRGETPTWQTVVAWAVVVMLTLPIYLLFVLLIYQVPRDFTVEGGTGTLTDPNFKARPPLAAGVSVALRPLVEFPFLPLAELRKVEDVVFLYNFVTHTLRVAAMARTASGSVEITGADGSRVRVEPDGSAFWARQGLPEATLLHTKKVTREEQVAWLNSGVVALQVVS